MSKNKSTDKQFCRQTRRDFIHTVNGGFTSLALAGMLGAEGYFNKANAAEKSKLNPLLPKKPHFRPKAKACIFLYMYGGPSQVDTFDYKPKLNELDGKTVEVNTFGRGGRRNKGRIVGCEWGWKQYGQCGQWVSDLFPHLATCVDDIAFLKSMTADSPIHGSAMLMMNSGRVLSGYPSLGSWINYGLGSVNQNLPGYVVMLDKTGGPISGAKNWSSGFMPASYQGTIFNTSKNPIMNLKHSKNMSNSQQINVLDSLNKLNGAHMSGREANSNLAARISAYELAYKMQSTAPEATNLDEEPEHVKKLYGINEGRTDDFGRKCLLARRLVERGVRFVQIYSGGAHNDDNWDAHRDMKRNHEKHAGNTDKPIAGLIKDLKQRGMLEDTLIIWGGEFGRQPTAEYAKGTGRDHNAWGFTTWMCGGGIKGGVSVGQTDELGAKAVEDRLHVRDMHATVLHQMGLDPNNLSYFYNSLDQKLVGVEEVEPIHKIIA